MQGLVGGDWVRTVGSDNVGSAHQRGKGGSVGGVDDELEGVEQAHGDDNVSSGDALHAERGGGKGVA